MEARHEFDTVATVLTARCWASRRGSSRWVHTFHRGSKTLSLSGTRICHHQRGREGWQGGSSPGWRACGPWTMHPCSKNARPCTLPVKHTCRSIHTLHFFVRSRSQRSIGPSGFCVSADTSDKPVEPPRDLVQLAEPQLATLHGEAHRWVLLHHERAISSMKITQAFYPQSRIPG